MPIVNNVAIMSQKPAVKGLEHLIDPFFCCIAYGVWSRSKLDINVSDTPMPVKISLKTKHLFSCPKVRATNWSKCPIEATAFIVFRCFGISGEYPVYFLFSVCFSVLAMSMAYIETFYIFPP